MKNFIYKFAQALEIDDVESLNADTNFQDLDEWSSLAALSLIAMVDEEYDAVMKAKDIRNAKTIGDLYNVIISKK